MAIRTIREVGDDVLRKTAKPVEQVTPAILNLLDDMLETLVDVGGAGLAAPQVGILRRVAIINIPDEDAFYEMINPEIIEAGELQEDIEGCLSIKGMAGLVNRPKYVKVKAFDRNLEPYEIEAEGFVAIAICHELDHLDGILYTDKATRMMEVDSQEYFDYLDGEDRKENGSKSAKRRAARVKKAKE